MGHCQRETLDSLHLPIGHQLRLQSDLHKMMVVLMSRKHDISAKFVQKLSNFIECRARLFVGCGFRGSKVFCFDWEANGAEDCSSLRHHTPSKHVQDAKAKRLIRPKDDCHHPAGVGRIFLYELHINQRSTLPCPFTLSS